jgi:osmoprotectant transport system substrate-binding protein
MPTSSTVHLRRARRPVASALLLALVLALASCGDGQDERGSVQPQGERLQLTLGTKDFTEAFIMGELYKQALAPRGYTVNLRKNIGSTEIIDKALTSGEIDAYPEYLGVALSVVAGREEVVKDDRETYDLAKRFYAQRGQVLSAQTPFSNVDAIATTTFSAQRDGLRTVGDLRRLKRFTLGARPEFATRFQGLKGMQTVYRLTNAQFKPLAIGTQYAALDAGDIDAANVFTTDGELASGDYKVLADPEKIFGVQHVALVIGREKLEQLGGNRFMSIIDAVNRRLTNDDMIAMNRAVDIGGQDEADVVARFLRENGLVPG